MSQTIGVSFFLQNCVVCGICFAVPQEFQDSRRRDGETFYCPNGHTMSYTETEAMKLLKEKDQVERRLQAQINDTRHALEVAKRERDKAVKEKRKVERRVAHGVCPCCNKTFADLSNHMVTEHKDFRLPSGKAPKQITGSVQ